MRWFVACAIALIGFGSAACHCFVPESYVGKTHNCVCSARCSDGVEAHDDVATSVCVKDGDDLDEDAVCVATFDCESYSSCECACEPTDEDCEHEGQNPARCS